MIVSCCELQNPVRGLGKSVLPSAPASQSCMGLVLEGLDLLEDSPRHLAARRLAEATEILLAYESNTNYISKERQAAEAPRRPGPCPKP